ncbi:hypothetical protein F4779DRAFT_602139 [Xylariaceae sp. FL0662B]|nr:hypothetical protein F4779DRAFT_602139 [Xylariaceae sp. FL0662B]
MVELDSNSRLVLRTSIALGVLVTLSVICRFLARWLKRAAIRWDDAWVVVAWLNFTAFFAVVTISMNLGAGQGLMTPISMEDIVMIRSNAKLDPRTNVKGELKLTVTQLEYISAFVFETANISSKISLLCLFRRIFTTNTFLKWSLGVLGLCVAWYLSAFFSTTFQCWPIHDTWTSATQDNCIDLVGFLMGYEIGNMICDIAIICLPIRMIHLLQLSRSQKVLLSGIFALGGFVCIASILRIRYTFNLQNPQDYIINVRIWSAISVASSVICANLPVLRPLFVRRETFNDWYKWFTRPFAGRGSSRTLGSTTTLPLAGRSISHNVNVSTGNYAMLDGTSREWKNPKKWENHGRDQLQSSDSSAYPLQSIRVNHVVDAA